MFIKRPFFRKFNKPFIKQNQAKINEQIRAPKVRVINEDGSNLGILDTNEAIKLAKEKELDLIEVTSHIDPPVCKITDYGKYQYQQEKKERKQNLRHKRGEIKGVRIGFSTSVHDLEIRARQIEKFFKEGNKVRVDMRLRGREKAHRDLAQEKLESFLNMIAGGVKKDEIKKSPQGMSITICQGKQENQSAKDLE